jgi:hypothetical protein
MGIAVGHRGKPTGLMLSLRLPTRSTLLLRRQPKDRLREGSCQRVQSSTIHLGSDSHSPTQEVPPALE